MEQEKSSFMLGLFGGIAAASLIAVVILLTNDNGQQPSELYPDDQNNVANNQPPTPTPVPVPPTPPPTANVEVKDTDWVRGKKDAKVTIIEFSDIQCPFCTRHHNTMRQVVDAYPDDVKWVFKHFPLDSIHPYARKAGEASECAGDQGQFWPYLDHLFENQAKINTEYLSQAAVDIGLDKAKFDSCLSSGKFKGKVETDYQQGMAAGVRGTPGNIINGQVISGAVPFESLKTTIESFL